MQQPGPLMQQQERIGTTVPGITLPNSQRDGTTAPKGQKGRSSSFTLLAQDPRNARSKMVFDVSCAPLELRYET